MDGREMNSPHGIIIFGANGSGKTTLGCELARVLNYKHMDIEDYAFADSEIPYTNERSLDEQTKLMLADIEKNHRFVLTAVTGDFGDIIPQYYKLAVHISASLDVRVERIKQRAYERHGERIREGGDMYEQHLEFVDFVVSRSLTRIEQWAKTLSCPIIRVDGKENWRKNAENIVGRFYEIHSVR
jgi:adenylate kinase family enzyme